MQIYITIESDSLILLEKSFSCSILITTLAANIAESCVLVRDVIIPIRYVSASQKSGHLVH